MQVYGKWLILGGLLILITSLILHFAGNKFSWLGHLPGDIRIERDNFKFYFPLTTMLIISLLVNLTIRLIKYLL
ncbi:MAG: DUF2905 domain-containing protein [Saprospiraceae bacterium]|nr:DUF2905 domain-containing protein [Saprospiraceae bacterium]